MTDHEELLKLFYYVIKKLKKEWGNQLQGMNYSQYLILKNLSRSGPQKAAHLAEVTQTSPSAITCASDKLVVEGYAERKRDKEDRRVVYLEITDKGRDFLESTAREQNKVIMKFFQGLPDEDIQHLIRIYNKISENFEQ